MNAQNRGVDYTQDIDNMINEGRWTEAHMALSELWRQKPSLSTATYVISRYETLKTQMNMIKTKLFILRSFTIEPCVSLLKASAYIGGIDLTIAVGNFNTYAQEILDPSSILYNFNPDTVILAVGSRDIAPDLWYSFPDLSKEKVTSAILRVSDSFRTWVKVFRSHSQANLIIHLLEVPVIPGNGVLDGQTETGQCEAIHSINREIRRLVSEYAGIYVLDYNGLIARYGHMNWHDEQKWLTMRMPISANCLVYMVQEWLRFIHPLTGKTCKALVLDLDNTLWGGVIGEDGFNGIKIGHEYPGAAYQAFQRTVLDLYHRGILLAICSKNNMSDAMEVLERHPGMLLRLNHFAALRINWNHKVQNLKEIATELNIGTDALAFVDDNPFECQLVRNQMPEVTVIELPPDPMGYAQALRDSPVFERLKLSSEDRERARYYVEERQRKELQQSTASLEDFYRSLEMEVEISSVTQETLSRIAQLTQRTNQFNLTTRRYTEQQIEEMANLPDWRVYSLRVKDRFGDSGLVGIAITHYRDDVCEIDSFLLSCRVIGRTVETSLLAFIVEQARYKGAKKLRGWFLPTKKNEPAKDFYPSHGFTKIQEKNGASCWEFDLMVDKKILSPPWIKQAILI